MLFRVSELALSIMEGAFELRTLPFRTEKKVEEVPEEVEGGVSAGAALESFSSALILCEMPDPRLTFFTMGLLAC